MCVSVCLCVRRQRVPALLDKCRLAYQSVTVEGTPRRLTVTVQGLATQQQAQESQVGWGQR